MINFLKFLRYLLIITLVSSVVSGCKKIDWDGDFEPDGKKRARKNVQEGKGFGTGGLFKKSKGGSFEFASSNELWRASLDTLDFMSFSNVDYSGGLIITDWYSETENKQSIKITVRFLSNEIRADGVEVILHKKTCNADLECSISKYSGKLNNEIKLAILKKATILEKTSKDTYKKDMGEYKINNLEKD